MHVLRPLLCLLLSFASVHLAAAQQVVPSLLRLDGLRSLNHQGSMKAAAYLPDGSAILLYDQGDGLRLIKTDAELSEVVAEVHEGGAGDVGVALRVDAQGFVYVGGTSSSGSLAGTPGSAFPSVADSSLNSFVARFSGSLNLQCLNFLGAGRTQLTGLAVTGDSVFVTGLTYSSSLPITSKAVQSSPPSGSTGNGFVERLSLDGSTLQYTTYLGGSDGTTTPAAIVADHLDNAYIVGSTSSSAYSDIAALQPFPLGGVSGFISKLTPAGDTFVFSTFVPGSGLSSVALSASEDQLLLTGDIAAGRFPIARVPGPLTSIPYQTLLRLSTDGQSLGDSAILFPGTQSALTLGANNTAWVTGNLTVPLSGREQHAGPGEGYALHLDAADAIDQAIRLGGTATDNLPSALLSTIVGPPGVRGNTGTVLVPGSASLRTDPTLLSSQSFDFSLSALATSVFPSAAVDLRPSTCTVGQPCTGSGAFLAELGAPTNQAVLTVSSGDLPFLTVRNRGSVPTSGLLVLSDVYSVNTDCTQTLAPGEQCGVLLQGSGPGTITFLGTNTPSQKLSLPSLPAVSSQPLTLSQTELDFSLVAAATPISRTFTVTNLGTAAQTFPSAPDNVPSGAPYSLTESASTCPGSPSAHVVSPAASCSITVTLTASTLQSNDGQVKAAWRVGSRDLLVTGFTQASSLAVSATEIVFGPQEKPPGSRLPRFLYLINASALPITHSAVTLPENSPFQVVDECPATLEPQSVCGMALTYTQTNSPALDSATLVLDGGLSVLVTGETVSPRLASTSLPASPLLVASSVIRFATPVTISDISTETQVVQITNPSTSALPIAASLLGDFTSTSTCGTEVAAGSTCALTLRFAPSLGGVREGLLTISAGSGFKPNTVNLQGTAADLLSLADTILNLGDTTVGEPTVRWMQVHNSLGTLNVSVDGGSFAVAILQDGGNGHGSLPASAFTPATAAPCINCWIGVQFLPQSPGYSQGVLQVSADPAGNAYGVPLEGTGLPAHDLQLSPSHISFGAVPVNSSPAPVLLTLANLLPGSEAASVQSITATGDFVLGPSPHDCTESIEPTTSCAVELLFTPKASGLRSGTLTVLTSAGTVTASLTGTGTPDPGLALSPVSLDFGNPGSQTIIVKNTASASIHVGPVSSDNAAFTPTTQCTSLAPQQACQLSVAYIPQNAQSTGSLTLPITPYDAAGGSFQTLYAVPLTGSLTASSAGLSIFPAQADFGTASVNAVGQVRQFTVTNTSTSPLAVDLAGARNFPLAALPDCGTLTPGASCTFSVLFLPENAGSLTGTVTATAVAPDGSILAQTDLYTQGYAAASGALTVSGGTAPQSPLSFGQVASGESADRTITVTNGGQQSVTTRRLTTSAPFHAISNCGILAPSASCNIRLRYTPLLQVASGSASAPRTDPGTLLIESNAQSSPDTIYLTGLAMPSTLAPPGSTALPTYTLSVGALTFPDTPSGTTSPAQSISLRNTGSVPVTIAGVNTSSDFHVTSDCGLVQPLAVCTISVAFAPPAGSPESVHASALEVTSDASSALDFVSLFGYAASAPLQLSTTDLSFGSVALGSSAQQTMMVRNATVLPVALGRRTVTGDFRLTGGTCLTQGSDLPGMQSCSLTISFTPTSTGPRTGSLTIASAGTPQSLGVGLSGNGIAGRLTTDRTSLNFGSLPLGASVTQSLRIANAGAANLSSIQLSLTGPDASLFGVNSTCADLSLAVGQTCSADITFAPLQSGPRTATLTIASSDPTGPRTIALSGTGAETPGFTLSVNGAARGAASIRSGGSATFPFLVKPQGGYNLPIAVTCTPITPAPNAVCSLSGATVALAGGPATGSVSIATESGESTASLLPLNWLFLPALLFGWKNRQADARLRSLKVLLLLATALVATGLVGCAGGPGSIGAPYTPAGTYSYQITARSTQGAVLTSSVALTVIVQ